MFEIIDIVHRKSIPDPWEEGEKIPWDDPGFSERMLAEHLTDVHDAASRRTSIIEAHVHWIHDRVLNSSPSSVLDLGCGPGLYSARLSALGHQVRGIDFAPASIRYAREQADQTKARTEYIQGDIRQVDFGSDFDLVMLIYGEFNVFRPSDARRILTKAHNSLKPGGTIILEVHDASYVKSIGQAARSWSSRESGLFSPHPHLLLKENFWHEDHQVAIERYYVVDAVRGSVELYASTMQAYTGGEYRKLLTKVGFHSIRQHRGLSPEHRHDGLFVLAATK